MLLQQTFCIIEFYKGCCQPESVNCVETGDVVPVQGASLSYWGDGSSGQGLPSLGDSNLPGWQAGRSNK